VNATLWQLSEQLVQHAALPATPKAGDSRSKLDESLKIKIQNSKFENRPAPSSFNQALMELGALICTPRQPRCQASTPGAQPSGCRDVHRGSACPLSRLCVAFREGRINQLPHLVPRPRPSPRRFIAFVAQKGDRFLVRQRPCGVLNAHLWEFPNFEVVNEAINLKRAARQELGAKPGKLVPFCSLKHSITRYRIRLDVFRVNADRLPSKPGKYRWAARSALLRLPFSSAHRKIIGQLTRKEGSC
jgi:A/G-specific adenine glycosylase